MTYNNLLVLVRSRVTYIIYLEGVVKTMALTVDLTGVVICLLTFLQGCKRL
jgi:hypothetical protein